LNIKKEVIQIFHCVTGSVHASDELATRIALCGERIGVSGLLSRASITTPYSFQAEDQQKALFGVI
jgi:hypothetical protein